jgi:hypothetical protein
MFERVAKEHPASLRAARGLGGILGALDPVSDADVSAILTMARNFPNDPLVSIGSAIVEIRSSPREDGERKLNAVLQISPPVSPEIADYARVLLDSAMKLDRMERLTKLLNAGRFDEGIPLLDAEIRNADPRDRPMLEKMRRMAGCGRDLEKLVDLVNNGRVEEARPGLEAIAADGSLAPYDHEAAQFLQRLAGIAAQSGTGLPDRK